MRFRLYATAGACLTVAAFTLPGLASTSPALAVTGPSAHPAAAPVSSTTAQPATLPSGAKEACPKPSGPLQEQCQSFIFQHAVKRASGVTPADASEPLTPTDLRSAYGLTSLSSSNGSGETVAIVDAYGDSYANSDLGTYRQEYNLGACTTSNGCLHIYNQNSGTSLPSNPPSNETGWEIETALDLEMVSAICPNCHIDLFQANSAGLTDLGTADKTAAAKDKFVSNSWSGGDFPGESLYDSLYFDHPGVAMAFASGDNGYGANGFEASYPASSPIVTSVGGTFLNGGGSSPWTQTVWNDANGATGSGCSSGEGKPAWQTDTGCANRTQNDVSAVADSPYGIDIYAANGGGDIQVGGTSAATPIITAIYALAGTPEANTYPVSYLYRDPSGLTDVTSGSNGTCESSRAYLCNAAQGYDGPTGLGTPNGSLTPFTAPTGDVVSVVNPGDIDLQTGEFVSLPNIEAHDTSGQALTYSASGLPGGLSINGSTGAITGTPSAAANNTVSVTATDGTANSTVNFKIAVVGSLTSAYHAVAGPVKLDWDSKCLDDANNSSSNGNKIQIWTCNGRTSQNWTYKPGTFPGGVGEIVIHNKCLDIYNRGTANGSKLDLWSCTGGANQQWYIVGVDGELFNPASGKCIDDPYNSTTNGKQLDIWSCNGQAWQAWTPPASPVLSGIAGKCLDDTGGSSANGTKVEIYSCNGLGTQKWTIGLDGSLRINGKCLDASGYGTTDGTKVQLYNCTGNINQEWIPEGYGQLENVNAEKCLADPNNSTANGTQLVLEDCHGDPGTVWAES